MDSITKLIKFLLGISFLIFIFVFPPLLLIALLIVPATFLYSKVSGQSYNFTIDQSETLYRFNKFGQAAWVLGGGFLLLLFLIALL